MDTTLLDEYFLDYTLYESQNSMLDEMMSLENALITESAGIIYINESIAETLKGFFDKIVNAVKEAFDKLRMKLVKISEDTLKANEENIRKGPEPDFKVKMYHEYDFDKMNNNFDGDKILSLIGADMANATVKPMTREDIARAAFGDGLIDPDTKKLKVTDALRKLITTNTIKDTTCTRAMLDNCLDFCINDYRKCLDKVKQDKEGLERQKTTLDKWIDGLNRMDAAKQTATESYYFTEADQKKDDGDDTNDKTSFESNKTEEEKKGTDRNSIVTKNLTNYVGLFGDLFSAKLKIINKAYIDYFNLISFYCRESKIKLVKKEKEGLNVGEKPL